MQQKTSRDVIYDVFEMVTKGRVKSRDAIYGVLKMATQRYIDLK